MKTLIDIDEVLLKKALTLSQSKTKKETVHRALEAFVKLRQRERLKEMSGSGAITWDLGDLKTARHLRETRQASLTKDSK
ncbi:MAG: type II toxin-antitoxin system VapB family antitoxin [Nitrospirae bacterium]|nr:type II toxin-antitoxin system VapB family antitoxin [Candidatus Manganitrophaceae bacterium]